MHASFLIDAPGGVCRYFLSAESKEQFVPVDRIIEPPVNNLDINRLTFMPFLRTQVLLHNDLTGGRSIEIYYDIEQNLINNLINI